MNRPSAPTPIQPAGGGPAVLPDGLPAELAAMLPPGNLVILGGPGSGKTALLEAVMHDLLARPGGSARFLTSSRQAAVASTERLLAALDRASGGELGCVTWYAFARGLVANHADLLDYRGEPRPLSGPEQWSFVRSLLGVDGSTVDWGPLAPLVDTRAFTDELAEFVLACERRLIDPEELLERASAGGGPTGARWPTSSTATGTSSPSRTPSTRPASSSRPATCSRTSPRSSPTPPSRWGRS
jgi:superfamily I DNA/RNA helicase